MCFTLLLPFFTWMRVKISVSQAVFNIVSIVCTVLFTSRHLQLPHYPATPCLCYILYKSPIFYKVKHQHNIHVYLQEHPAPFGTASNTTNKTLLIYIANDDKDVKGASMVIAIRTASPIVSLSRLPLAVGYSGHCRTHPARIYLIPSWCPTNPYIERHGPP